jgi:hypothetical protein
MTTAPSSTTAFRLNLTAAFGYLGPVAVTVAALLVVLTQIDLRAVSEAASELDLAALAVAVVALGLGAALASLRLQIIARDLGYPMRFRDAVAALSLGQIAGSLFFQVVGQTIARSAFLSRRGVPLAGTLVMTGYERLTAVAVSFAMAAAGAWHLFGRITLDVETGGAEFVRLAVALVATFAACTVFVWGKDIARIVRLADGPQAVARIGRLLALSIAIQLSTMAAYIAVARSLVPEIGGADLAAAAAVVMLAAALPISLAGWGIRELSAIYALGIIGFSKEASLVVALVVGFAALAVVGAMAVGSMMAGRARPSSAPVPAPLHPAIDYGAALAWCIPLLTATAVFFQIHVPLSNGRLNVNLADPLALIGGALFVATAIRARQLPAWRLPGLNLHVAVMTALLLLSFLHGWLEFGWISWAFTNRVFGWLVLLGYAATGALIVVRGGDAGFSMLLRTFAFAAMALILLDAALFIAIVLGAQVPTEIVRYRIDGFSQNANAFALQLLFVLGAVVVAIPRPPMLTAMLSIALVGLWLTGSRSGLIALAILTIAMVVTNAVDRKRMVAAFASAAVVILAINWLPEIVMAMVRTGQSAMHFVVSLWPSGSVGSAASAPFTLPKRDFSALEVVASGYESSNTQRIASLKGGWDMFAESPIFGAGLGAFIETYTREHKIPLVIHSTPLWLLAELGVVGFLAFAAPFIRVLKYETYQAGLRDPVRIFLILALLGFAVMAAVHDLLYQRSLWLLVGAAMACSRYSPRPAPATA